MFDHEVLDMVEYVISVSVGEIDQPGTTASLLNLDPSALPTPSENSNQTDKPKAPKPVSLFTSERTSSSFSNPDSVSLESSSYLMALRSTSDFEEPKHHRKTYSN
ncbi:rRNA-binding ribosome biosynthesis protein rpf2 [Puccinia graminis f. sp. tritici]|uniref:rRNA-binding ribosome biosynthesis protein rpf2 n=1 Tax=Puccinia graminis f. sp. tritici TaxID=56615 RepID=A0A5B0NAM7_PUCGR|nr:rRNA-binding ribosome biosynthesis protein rpf2 [Puccinia graminis f. sp. tritici]